MTRKSNNSSNKLILTNDKLSLTSENRDLTNGNYKKRTLIRKCQRQQSIQTKHDQRLTDRNFMQQQQQQQLDSASD